MAQLEFGGSNVHLASTARRDEDLVHWHLRRQTELTGRFCAMYLND
jgi:hypothetical protein